MVGKPGWVVRVSKVHILNLMCCGIAIGLALNVRILVQPRNWAALYYIRREFAAWLGSCWR